MGAQQVKTRSARSAFAGRAAWSFGDQALSSLTNAALSIFIARITSAEGYGYFAVAFTVYTFLLGTCRALVNQPFAMRWPGAEEDDARWAAAAGTGLALVFGLLCAAVVVPVALLFAAGAGPTVATMCVLLPLLLVQDVWRAVFIARQRPRSAAANDALWTVLQFAGLSVAVAIGVRDPVPLVMVWAVAGWVAAVVAVAQGRTRPAVRSATRFARKTVDLSRYLVAEWVTVLGAAQIALLLVATIGSAVDVGSLRGAQTLLGPLNILGIGAFGFLVPELARRPWLTARQLRMAALATSAGLGLINLAWGAVLLLLPENAGRAVLGSTWTGARETILAMTLWATGIAVATGPIVVIRSRGRPRDSFIVNVLLGFLLLAGAPIGLVLGGAEGAAWGFALATLSTAPLFGIRMERILGSMPSGGGHGGDDAGGHPGGDGAGGHVDQDDRTRGDDRAVADPHRPEHARSGADVHAVADDGLPAAGRPVAEGHTLVEGEVAARHDVTPDDEAGGVAQAQPGADPGRGGQLGPAAP